VEHGLHKDGEVQAAVAAESPAAAMAPAFAHEASSNNEALGIWEIGVDLLPRVEFAVTAASGLAQDTRLHVEHR
jgi:hypothetical protein